MHEHCCAVVTNEDNQAALDATSVHLEHSQENSLEAASDMEAVCFHQIVTHGGMIDHCYRLLTVLSVRLGSAELT